MCGGVCVCGGGGGGPLCGVGGSMKSSGSAPA